MDALGWSLVVLCLVLAGVLAAQLNWPQGAASAEPAPEAGNEATQAGTAASVPASGTLTVEPLEKYREIVDRPLFHVSRRPTLQDAEDTATAAATELRNLTLIGVLISPETKLAIFRDKGPQPLRLEAGANVGKWSLVEVRGDGVTLRRGGETYVIPLHKGESAQWSSSDGTQPAAAPPSGGSDAGDRDAARIQTQKAPTREQRFLRKRSS
jgi:hypothetical protein